MKSHYQEQVLEIHLIIQLVELLLEQIHSSIGNETVIM